MHTSKAKEILTGVVHDLSIDYQQYKNLLEDLLAQGKTTGANQSKEYVDYARINIQRMKRIEKTTELSDELKTSLSRIAGQYLFLAITEGWCGDAAQNLPVFHLIENACSNIELRLVLRDENPDLMNNYLTDGARAIPKIICLDKHSFNEIFIWGPRPAPLQQIALQMKKENRSKEEKGLIVQNWYNADKTKSLQAEIVSLVQNL